MLLECCPEQDPTVLDSRSSLRVFNARETPGAKRREELFFGTDGDILREIFHLADQSLNGLSTPDLHTTPKGA